MLKYRIVTNGERFRIQEVIRIFGIEIPTFTYSIMYGSRERAEDAMKRFEKRAGRWKSVE